MVNLSLYLINLALYNEDARGSGGIAPLFIDLRLDGSKWSASRPCHFTIEKRSPSFHRIGGWLGPRAETEAVELRKVSCPYREWNTDRPACSSSLNRLSYILLYIYIYLSFNFSILRLGNFDEVRFDFRWILTAFSYYFRSNRSM
jgi:hypothetical protein